MSSPNDRIAAINCATALNLNSNQPLLHHSCTVYIGKEQYRINLTPLENVSKPTWKKQRSFDQLETAVLSLRNTYQVEDLMDLVRQEISIDVDPAAQDATKGVQNLYCCQKLPFPCRPIHLCSRERLAAKHGQRDQAVARFARVCQPKSLVVDLASSRIR